MYDKNPYSMIKIFNMILFLFLAHLFIFFPNLPNIKLCPKYLYQRILFYVAGVLPFGPTAAPKQIFAVKLVVH